jgi:hypothetical protein
VTSLSGTKPYFFSSLSINLSAARLFIGVVDAVQAEIADLERRHVERHETSVGDGDRELIHRDEVASMSLAPADSFVIMRKSPQP